MNENILTSSKKWFKENIPIGTVFGLIFTLFGVLWFSGRIKLGDMNDTGFICIIWLIFNLLLQLPDYEKGSLSKIVKNVAQIQFSPELTEDVKNVIIGKILLSLFNPVMNGHLTKLLNDIEKKQVRKSLGVIDEPTKEDKKKEPEFTKPTPFSEIRR